LGKIQLGWEMIPNPLEVGENPTWLGNDPKDEKEQAKMKAGDTYTAVARYVHWVCFYENMKGD
jgi:hypothetical protein